MASSQVATAPIAPKMGPDPVLLSRKEVDMLYVTMEAVTTALQQLGVDYIVTGGSLLGAVRQHSILFCDDDIDIAIIEKNGSESSYDLVSKNLQRLLGKDFTYSVRPWEGGDRVRPKQMSSIFLDLFTIRRFDSMEQLVELISVKKNGRPQSEEYVNTIVEKIQSSAHSQGEMLPLCPFWHFNTRKAVEMWAKEVYRDRELFPLSRELKFGPLVGVHGPRTPVRLLKRAFGLDCFEVYFQSGSHKIVSQPLAANNSVADITLRVTAAETETKTAISTHVPKHKKEQNSPSIPLPPLLQAGGAWEGGRKVLLEPQHYLPMQPVLKSRRRPTLHSKEALFAYLALQEAREEAWMLQEDASVETGTVPSPVLGSVPTGPDSGRGSVSLGETLDTVQLRRERPRRTIYMDGVFDLFHIGHLEAIRQCAALGDRVVIGVTGDADAADYKRPPIISQSHRVAIVSALREVDAVVCPCPLVVTEPFMQQWGIDLVVHGFASDADAERQEEFFALPMHTGRFQRIGYFDGLSTTDIIDKIRKLPKEDENNDNDTKSCCSCCCNTHSSSSIDHTKGQPDQESYQDDTTAAAQALALRKPQWFGAAVAAATSCSPNLPRCPFPLSLQLVIEPFVRKATSRREEVLCAIRAATGVDRYDFTMKKFYNQQAHIHAEPAGLATEGVFTFSTTQFPLRKAFLRSAGLPLDTDLARLHEDEDAKDLLFSTLTRNRSLEEAKMAEMGSLSPSFQEEFDRFVTTVCAPYMASLFQGEDKGVCEEIYYQAFPCIRVVQPGDFSIGPHADVSYGHHPCSVNFYLPLTEIGGTSSLFLESSPGKEDWHPIKGGYGVVTHFAGAVCAHWTVENHTADTRVSLDFRLILGPLFHALQCSGGQPGGQLDVYRQKEGYYSCCRRVAPAGSSSSSSSSSSNGSSSNVEHNSAADLIWERQGPMLVPDARIGYPWTVRDMAKHMTRNKLKRFQQKGKKTVK